MNSTEVNATRERKISAGLEGVEVAKNISSKIAKAVQDGDFTLNINDTVFVPDEQSLNISEPKQSCDAGQTFRDGICGN